MISLLSHIPKWREMNGLHVFTLQECICRIHRSKHQGSLAALPFTSLNLWFASTHLRVKTLFAAPSVSIESWCKETSSLTQYDTHKVVCRTVTAPTPAVSSSKEYRDEQHISQDWVWTVPLRLERSHKETRRKISITTKQECMTSGCLHTPLLPSINASFQRPAFSHLLCAGLTSGCKYLLFSFAVFRQPSALLHRFVGYLFVFGSEPFSASSSLLNSLNLGDGSLHFHLSFNKSACGFSWHAQTSLFGAFEEFIQGFS